MQPDIRINNSNLRKSIIEKRKNNSEWLRQSKVIANSLISTNDYISKSNILVYSDYNREVATEVIINDALNRGKTVYLPVCKEDYQLEFYKVSNLNELKVGLYGIMEPLQNECWNPESENDTLCIVPGVAFDSNCNRMGYGKGYYDRFLDKYPGIIKIGLCFSFQIVEKLIVNSHDVPLNKLITERNIYVRS